MDDKDVQYKKDWDAGYAMLNKWEADEPCHGPQLQVGALVRLVREMVRRADEVIADGFAVNEPEAVAWLSEAKALVGEVNDADT